MVCLFLDLLESTKIRRTFAIRQKRYYGPSKMNLYGLIDQFALEISVSYQISFFTTLYTFLIFNYSLNIFNYFEVGNF